jgi:ubiquinone/menaquinone biosynthesis C-methylase UbiE
MGFFDRFRKAPAPSATPAEIRDFFLRAAQDEEEHYPSSIDPQIQFVRRILVHLGDLGRARVADIGSGKGRFAKIVKERNPQATVVALDLAETMLRYVPPNIDKVAATMTQIPLATGSLAGAWAVESLEHAVDIPAAVAELCRIVRPGGKIAIIDKNVRSWGQLETPSWERWFDQKEIANMLGQHCTNVASQPITYWDEVPTDGLFLLWLAEK